MKVEHNHDGHELVVRLLTLDREPSSAYVVPSWGNIELFSGGVHSEVREYLEADDNEPF